MTLRELVQKMPHLTYWSDSLGYTSPDSYGLTLDLIDMLDERFDCDGWGNTLPSEADREFRIVEHQEGESWLFPPGEDFEPKYILVSEKVFLRKALQHHFEDFMSHSHTSWGEEERSIWLERCESEGFDIEEAARLYDEEWARFHHPKES